MAQDGAHVSCFEADAAAGRRRATDRRIVALVTGFGPFPTCPVNASGELARALARAVPKRLPWLEVVAAELPTEWDRGLYRLDGLLGEVAPDIALHFGVASRARGFEIEARARNHCHPSEDAAGQTVTAGPLHPAGPEALAAGIRASEVVRRLRLAGLPAYLSRDAGSYLCNATLYSSLSAAQRCGYMRPTGFVHVPSNLSEALRWPRRRMTPLAWDEAVRGGVEILAACLPLLTARRVGGRTG